MFKPETIKSRIDERPFRPLRIVASEGKQFDIYHPDMIIVSERDVMIGLPSKTNPVISSQVIRVAIIHIVALEDLPVPAPPGNGQQQG